MMRSIARAVKRRLLTRKRVFENVLAEENVTLDGCLLIGPIRIGYRSYANDSLLRHVTIGRFCSIGRRCSIGAANHSVTGITTHSSAAPDDFDSDPLTVMGNDVWIGDNVVILAGLKIGDGAVIGAGAIVRRDVEPYAIVAGVPARLIRHRFAADVIAKLLKSSWWDFGDVFQGAECRGDVERAIAFFENMDRPVLPQHHRVYVTRF